MASLHDRLLSRVAKVKSRCSEVGRRRLVCILVCAVCLPAAAVFVSCRGIDDDSETPQICKIAFRIMEVMNQSNTDVVEEVSLQTVVKDYLTHDYVERLSIVNKDVCVVQLRNMSNGTLGRQLKVRIGSIDAFESRVDQVQKEIGIPTLKRVPIQYVEDVSFFAQLAKGGEGRFLMMILTFSLLLSASKIVAPDSFRALKPSETSTTFANVAGLQQPKFEVREFVDFLKDPAKYKKLGARIPRGALLVGPPGTGKTLLAQAIAGEAKRPFFSVSGSDFTQILVGIGRIRIRSLFSEARRVAPSIIYIDEIDALGRKRSSGGGRPGGSDAEWDNTLIQILVEMDGFKSDSGVVVLASTNRADTLDPALTRAGRFDRQIHIGKPDLAEREQIFALHLKKLVLRETLTLDAVAKRLATLSPGFVGADIANACNESAIFAARRDSSHVDLRDFEQAMERIIGGLARASVLSQADKRRVATHEAGHAVTSWFLEFADPLVKISIVPRTSGALGFTQYLPNEIKFCSREVLLDMIAVALGGRASDELFSGGATTGAADDLGKVTKIAYSMIAQHGMSQKLGLLSYEQPSPSEHLLKPFSEQTANTIDCEARVLVEEQYKRTRALLTQRSSAVKAVADALMERETLSHDDLVALLGPSRTIYSQTTCLSAHADQGALALPCAEHPVEAAPAGQQETKRRRVR